MYVARGFGLLLHMCELTQLRKRQDLLAVVTDMVSPSRDMLVGGWVPLGCSHAGKLVRAHDCPLCFPLLFGRRSRSL